MVNERWKRDNLIVKKLTGMGIGLSIILWYLSYSVVHFATAETAIGQWFTVVTITTLLGAIGVTISSIIGSGIILTDKPPLEGSNY